MLKSDARTYYLEKRKLLSNDEITLLNQSVIEQLKTDINFSSIEYIHLFLPIKNHNEIDLWPFIHWIWETHQHITIVVPKSDFKTRIMTSIELSTTTTLVYDNYNIPEPNSGKVISNDLIDIVLTPLLICDLKGYRVGYGKGFYDTFFKSCRYNIKRIGIGHFNPIKEIENIDEWDIPLSHFISPNTSLKF